MVTVRERLREGTYARVAAVDENVTASAPMLNKEQQRSTSNSDLIETEVLENRDLKCQLECGLGCKPLMPVSC
jgi:hypothetical protein